MSMSALSTLDGMQVEPRDIKVSAGRHWDAGLEIITYVDTGYCLGKMLWPCDSITNLEMGMFAKRESNCMRKGRY